MAMRSAPLPLIECEEVWKRFGPTIALAGVTLKVDPGSIFGFLGPNGAGKSTLVKILTGLARPGSGRLTVLGGKPGTREVQRQMGYLPELFRFPSWLTGAELLCFHGRLLGVDANPASLLDLVGLGADGHRRIAEYSKGMQQRLGLAQALIGRPPLVLLDEPTSALDPLGRLHVRDVLLHLRQQGMTVFLNSHLLTEIEKLCDQVAVIDRGRVVAQGSIGEMLTTAEVRIRVGQPAEEHVRRFLARVALLGHRQARWEDAEFVVPVDSTQRVPELVRAAVEEGLSVYEAYLARRSLEEAFVSLVSGKTRAESEEEAVSASVEDPG